MSVLHHPGKAKVVMDALSRMTMGSVEHVPDDKKESVKRFIYWIGWVFGWNILQMGFYYS